MLENNKREMKLRSSFSGSSKAWARGRRLYPVYCCPDRTAIRYSIWRHRTFGRWR